MHILKKEKQLTSSYKFRYFPYYLTVGCITILGIIGLFWLIFQRRLLPSIVMIGAFMLLALWMVGLVAVAIELFGPSGSVQSHCNLQVFNKSPKGATEFVLAWLQQRNICKLRYVAARFDSP
jgi:hypothetical protein